MATETYRHTMTTAFKNWHSLAVGAVLLAFSVFLTSTAFASLKTAQTALQGWAMLVIAGYAFVSAIFLGASPLSENSTLTESFPGVFDHFKSFIVGGLFYAIGNFLVTVEAASLGAPEQVLDADHLYHQTANVAVTVVRVKKEGNRDASPRAGEYPGNDKENRLYTPLNEEESKEIEKLVRIGRKDATISFL